MSLETSAADLAAATLPRVPQAAIERPASLTEAAYERIRDAIVTRALRPGVRVTEAGLARDFQVSKTPVREALLRLREVGLIEVDASGNSIVTSTEAALRDAYEIRELLQPYAARSAAKNATPAQAAAILDLAKESLKLARERNLDELRRVDQRLQRAVAACCGNGRIAKAIDDACALTATIQANDATAIEHGKESAESYVRTARAIAAHDGDTASSETLAHVLSVRDRVIRKNAAGDSP
jgi:DNA-binding GntR family transcriptional regulator